MIFRWDSEVMALYVTMGNQAIGPGESDKTIEVTESVLADYSSEGILLGIEVLNVLTWDIKRTTLKLNLTSEQHGRLYRLKSMLMPLVVLAEELKDQP